MTEFLASSTVARLAVLLGIFAVVAIVVYLLMIVASRRLAIRSELASLSGPASTESEASPGSVKFQERETAWARLVDMIERTGLNLTDTRSERLRDKVIRIGTMGAVTEADIRTDLAHLEATLKDLIT